MNLPDPVESWLTSHGDGAVSRTTPVGGGCINNGARLETTQGATFFLKQNSSAPPLMFEREAEGLQAIGVPDGPRVPEPLLAGEQFLLLEDLRPAPRSAGYWTEFGRQLAALHEHTDPQFGFEHDNFLGSTPQPNPPTEDGYQFFAEHRLIYQARLARQRGLLEPGDVQHIEAIAGRLRELVPEQPASLIHGDLWSGNATTGSAGEPAIIDPAAHYGWAEAELGMTALFGGFSDEFYAAYEAARPLAPGWRERLPLYNLYHLLNHLNLFGRGYLGQVQHIVRQFS